MWMLVPLYNTYAHTLHHLPYRSTHQQRHQHQYLEMGTLTNQNHRIFWDNILRVVTLTALVLFFQNTSAHTLFYTIYHIVARINSGLSRTPEGIRRAMSKREAQFIAEKNIENRNPNQTKTTLRIVCDNILQFITRTREKHLLRYY